MGDASYEPLLPPSSAPTPDRLHPLSLAFFAALRRVLTASTPAWGVREYSLLLLSFALQAAAASASFYCGIAGGALLGAALSTPAPPLVPRLSTVLVYAAVVAVAGVGVGALGELGTLSLRAHLTSTLHTALFSSGRLHTLVGGENPLDTVDARCTTDPAALATALGALVWGNFLTPSSGIPYAVVSVSLSTFYAAITLPSPALVMTCVVAFAVVNGTVATLLAAATSTAYATTDRARGELRRSFARTVAQDAAIASWGSVGEEASRTDRLLTRLRSRLSSSFSSLAFFLARWRAYPSSSSPAAHRDLLALRL